MCRSLSLLSLFLAPLLLASGCYRTVSVRPAEVSGLRVEANSAQVVYRDNHTLTIDEFDDLAVETSGGPEGAPPGAWPEHGTYDFRAPITGSLSPNTLELRDGRSRAVFAASTVREIEFSENAPDRALIVLGVAVGSAVLLTAIVGAIQSPRDCDGELCNLDGLRNVALAFPIGLGMGLAVSLALTSKLGTEGGTPAAVPMKPQRVR